MRYFIGTLFLLLILSSCNSGKKSIVDVAYADSLIAHYTQPLAIKANEEDLQFWLKRINPNNTGITNESKYASALIARFNLLGDINDVIKADSILQKVDDAFAHKEASPCMTIGRNAILQHQFNKADSLLMTAKKIGIRPYESLAASFDVNFEQGRILLAKNNLKQMAAEKDFGYQFRNAKLAHYEGDIENSIASMKKAVELAGNNISLKQAALSNLADLYLHNGDLQNAFISYRSSIYLNAADLHSIMGIGWIALVHDKNDSLAEKIFRFVHSQTKSPDPLFKLVQTMEARGDSIAAIKYAREFEQQVTQPAFGNMYNKYLIELYTGVLHEPAKAVVLAQRELSNRATPQTYAWNAWALLADHKTGEAFKIYQQHVSGKPLEGLELYWMGKLMQELNKGYNARQFFDAAFKNQYDLSPVYVADIKNEIEF